MQTLYGSTVKFTVTASGENLTYSWYYKPRVYNGAWTKYGNTTNSISVLATSNDEYQYRCAVSNDVYSGDSAIYSDVAVLDVIDSQIYKAVYITETPTAPKITKQPQSAQVVAGEKLTFRVEAEGDNLVYEWQYKSNVTNAAWTRATSTQGTGYNTNTFTTVTLMSEQTGWQYRCVVRDSDGYYYGDQCAVFSDNATIQVTPAGYTTAVYINESYNITSDPISQMLFPGGTATFKVEAEGNTTLSYRWLYKTTDERSSWTEVPTSMATGTQTDTLTITNVTEDLDKYSFRCSVGGEYYVYEKSLLSNIAYLIVLDPAQIATAVVDTSKMMMTEWKIPEDNITITLPVEGNGLDITVDWGDGSSDKITSSFPTHTYETAGTYTISIAGNCQKWGYNGGGTVAETSSYYTYTQYLTKLIQWGELNATQYGFSDCSNLELVSGDATGNAFNNVTRMDNMFYGCSGLTELDVSTFDTSKVTTMLNMFNGCSGLTELDVSNFDTTKVTNMGGMFGKCSGLTSLDVSNFNTSEVTNMNTMFSDCSGLTSLNLSNFDTSKVTNMSFMFDECFGLTSINLSNFNTSNVTTTERMFNSCKALTSLDVSGFDTSKVTKMSSMFGSCEKLTELDVSNFNTSNVTDMYCMFDHMVNLTELDVSNFDTSKVTNMSNMFGYMSNLTSLDVSNFDTANVTKMNQMFFGCSKLTSLDLTNFDTSNITNATGTFSNCTALEYIVLGENIELIQTVGNTPALHGFIVTKAVTSTSEIDWTPASAVTLPEGANIYVPNDTSKAMYQEKWSANIASEKIKAFLELKGETSYTLMKGAEYVEPGYTVFGYDSTETEKIGEIGYVTTVTNAPNTLEVGTYTIIYSLIEKDSAETAYQTTRNVIVLGGPNVELFANGVAYTGDWANQIVAYVYIQNQESTWIEYKISDAGEWTSDNAEITFENGIAIVKLKHDYIEDLVYFREINVTGNATTIASDGYMYRQEKVAPTASNVTYTTTDKKIIITTKLQDDQGVLEYAIIEQGQTPSEWVTLPTETVSGDETIGLDNIAVEVESEAFGSNTYVVWIKDKAGNIGQSAPFKIVKDITPPTGTVKIKDAREVDGELYVNTEEIVLLITAEDNVSTEDEIKMAVYNEKDYEEMASKDEINWEPLAARKTWQTEDGDGPKRIYILLKDAAGNIAPKIVEYR